MKGSMRAALIAISAWAMAFVVVAAAATVCSSCGTSKPAASRASCQGR
jgi:hypothetical protein